MLDYIYITRWYTVPTNVKLILKCFSAHFSSLIHFSFVLPVLEINKDTYTFPSLDIKQWTCSSEHTRRLRMSLIIDSNKRASFTSEFVCLNICEAKINIELKNNEMWYYDKYSNRICTLSAHLHRVCCQQRVASQEGDWPPTGSVFSHDFLSGRPGSRITLFSQTTTRDVCVVSTGVQVRWRAAPL